MRPGSRPPGKHPASPLPSWTTWLQNLGVAVGIRSILSLSLVVALAPSAAHAQSPVTSFAELRTLVKAGDTVTVSDSSGATSKGSVAELTPSTLVLRLGTEQRRYTEADVTRIRQRRQDSLLNGALIGAGIGAALAAMGNSKCSNDFSCTDSAGTFFALGIGIGVGAGVGVDAAIVREKVIFDRLGKPGVAMSLGPAIGGGRAGATLSLRF